MGVEVMGASCAATLKRPAEGDEETAAAGESPGANKRPKSSEFSEQTTAWTSADKSPFTAAKAFQDFSSGAGSLAGHMLARQSEEERQKALPVSERSEWGKLTLREQELMKMGIQPPPRNYTAEDKKGWTNEEKAMYKGQHQLYGKDQASAFLRAYFKENEGKPRPPRKDLLQPHASGYAIFVSEETAKRVEADETTGKKMTKLIKASWAATDAAAQEQFVSRFMTQKENFDAKWDAYEDALEAWEIEQEKGKENTDKDNEPVAVP